MLYRYRCFWLCRVILSGCQWFVFSKGGSEDERCFRYSGQGSEPVEGTKTKTNNILTGTELETKSNFKVPNRIKHLKWPLTGKKVNLSFHLIFKICCQPITNSSSRLRSILEMREMPACAQL